MRRRRRATVSAVSAMMLTTIAAVYCGLWVAATSAISINESIGREPAVVFEVPFLTTLYEPPLANVSGRYRQDTDDRSPTAGLKELYIGFLAGYSHSKVINRSGEKQLTKEFNLSGKKGSGLPFPCIVLCRVRDQRILMAFLAGNRRDESLALFPESNFRGFLRTYLI